MVNSCNGSKPEHTWFGGIKGKAAHEWAGQAQEGDHFCLNGDLASWWRVRQGSARRKECPGGWSRDGQYGQRGNDHSEGGQTRSEHSSPVSQSATIRTSTEQWSVAGTAVLWSWGAPVGAQCDPDELWQPRTRGIPDTILPRTVHALLWSQSGSIH